MDVQGFDCGDPGLNTWLLDAWLNEERGTARTFAVCEESKVVAYYSLSASSIVRKNYPGKTHGFPSQVPAVMIGRFGVATGLQGTGMGRSLFINALEKIIAASTFTGAVAVVLHVQNERALKFWSKMGFIPAKPIQLGNPLAWPSDLRDDKIELYLPMATARAILAARITASNAT